MFRHACFNKPIDDNITSVTHLILGYFFDHPINILPKSITEIRLWQHHRRFVTIPPGIKIVELG